MDITQYLYSLRGMGAKLGLERVERLLDALGNPQEGLRVILVGGTSGKGSTAAMLASILSEAGFRTGRFTSPHLSSLTERIAVDGKEISEEELAGIVEEIRHAIEGMKESEGFEHPTFFEVITAAAFMHFRRSKADFAVLEVGLGGRLDATNAAEPLVSVITNVSLEHTKILGDTVKEIAREKAGIIREGGMLVTSAQGKALEVLEAVCREKGCRMLRVLDDIKPTPRESGRGYQRFDADVSGKTHEGLKIPLLGRHQLENASCALGAAHALTLLGFDIPESAIRKGLERTIWPGRMEIIQDNPVVMVDAAKDPHAMKRLAEAIQEIQYERLMTVLAISSDKDIRGMVANIAPISDVIIASKHNVTERAADPQLIAKEVGGYCLIEPDLPHAIEKALSLSQEGGLILITGSVFTAGEARDYLLKRRQATLGRELSETPRR